MSIFNFFKKSKPAPLIKEPEDSVENFMPKVDDMCFCGSKKPFGQCCGSKEKDRKPPYGVFIFEDYVDADFINEIVAFAEQQKGQRLMMIDSKRSTPDNIVKVVDDRRITERVELTDLRPRVNNVIRDIYIELANKCFASELDWYESPDLMRYKEGGHYMRHADNENMDARTKTWSKVIDRDISMLVYLNNDFEGGELTFFKFNYQIKPKAGMVVLFPSDHRYLHQAEKVKSGVRYAIVSWAAVKGVTKIAENPPLSAVAI